MRIDANHKHLLRLVRKGRDDEGWAKVSSVVWPFIAECPTPLVELKQNADGSGLAKLTKDGNLLLDWMD